MVTFDFDSDRIYKVLVRPKNSTELEFGPGETVSYVSAGDKTAFVITVPSSRAFIEIKPKWDDTSTNLLVVTNRHTYHVDLQSTGAGRKWYTRVAWNHDDATGLDATVPGGELAASVDTVPLHHASAAGIDVVSQGIALDEMNPRYVVSGDAEFRPVQVFDDGTRTYVRLPDRLQEYPALFMVTPDTRELALVNYVVAGAYLVVQRTMDRFVLQLGKAQVWVDRQGSGTRGTFPRDTTALSRPAFGDVGERPLP